MVCPLLCSTHWCDVMCVATACCCLVARAVPVRLRRVSYRLYADPRLARSRPSLQWHVLNHPCNMACFQRSILSAFAIPDPDVGTAGPHEQSTVSVVCKAHVPFHFLFVRGMECHGIRDEHDTDPSVYFSLPTHPSLSAADCFFLTSVIISTRW